MRTQFNPPLSPASMEFNHQTWALFERILAYGVRNTDTSDERGVWNAVAYHLYNAREATSASIDAWAIGVSVAVEAVASVIELPDDRDKAQSWAKFSKRALEWLEEQRFPEEVRRRARGLIEKTGSKGTKQKLRELAEKGYLDKKYVDAWDRLRNRHVHPNLADLKLPGPNEYRELFQRLWQVGTLLHQLTFYIIQYEGPFTDYGRAECPSRQYPLLGQDDSVSATP